MKSLERKIMMMTSMVILNGTSLAMCFALQSAGNAKYKN
jgi:hypothetical protein